MAIGNKKRSIRYHLTRIINLPAVMFYPILILGGRLPIQHDSEALAISWIPFLKGIGLYHQIPTYLPNYSFGLPNYFVLYQDPISIFTVVISALLKISNLVTLFAFYIAFLNLICVFMISYVCRALNVKNSLSYVLIYYLLLTNSPTWGYNFHFRLNFSILLLIFTVTYLRNGKSLKRFFSISLLNLNFIFFGQLTYVLPFLYTIFAILCLPFVFQIKRKLIRFPPLNVREVKAKLSPISTLTYTITIILLILFIYFAQQLQNLVVTAPGRDTDGSLSLANFLSYGGNVGWEKYLVLLGPFKALSHNATPDFNLAASFLTMPIVLFGLIRIRSFRKEVLQTYLALVTCIFFVLLLCAPVEAFSRLFYLYVPFFDQIRHLSYLSWSVNTLSSFAATLAISEILNVDIEKIANSKDLSRKRKTTEALYSLKPFKTFGVRFLFFIIAFYPLAIGVFLHLFNLSWPKILKLYPTKEFLCGVKDMEEFRKLEICNYIYQDWKSNKGSLLGQHSVNSPDIWKIYVISICTSIAVLLSTKLISRQRKLSLYNSRNFRLMFGWLVAVEIIVFGAGIVNYLQSTHIIAGGPFGSKGLQIGYKYESIYSPIEMMDRTKLVSSRPIALVNDQQMISILYNNGSCKYDSRLDLVARSLYRNSMEIHRPILENYVNPQGVLCDKVGEEFGSWTANVNIDGKVIEPVTENLAYNHFQYKFKPETISVKGNGFLRIALPFDEEWKLIVDGKRRVIEQGEGGFISAKIDNVPSSVEIFRGEGSIYAYTGFFFLQLFSLIIYLSMIPTMLARLKGNK